jgi:cytochrome P450
VTEFQLPVMHELMTPAVFADPYPAYQRYRDQTPLHYLHLPAGIFPGVKETVHAWALMKHEHVMAALKDHDTFSSEKHMHTQLGPRVVMLTDDPPRHTRLRRLVSKAFTQKRIDALQPWISAIATELLGEMCAGEADVVSCYTMPLPVKVIARMLGIPGEEYAMFKRWTTDVMSGDPTGMEAKQKSTSAMVAYFGQMALERRAHGAEDLITALVEAEVDGESLEDWEILGFCMLLLIAGNDTTTNLMSNMLHILSDQPELWRRLREDRSLVEPMIDETLRYASPVHRFYRGVTREVTFAGVTMSKGDHVEIFFGAANRDPAVFSDPDEFRLHRDANPHVAFGAGIHFCLGAPLARMEARVSLNAFLDRFSTLKPGAAPAARQWTSPIVLGFQQLPLVVGS